MKKVLSFLLAIVMVFTITVPAFAYNDIATGQSVDITANGYLFKARCLPQGKPQI